jgi:hypothetical protein
MAVNPAAAIMIGNLYVSITLEPNLDVSTIESPFTGKLDNKHMEEFINHLSHEFKAAKDIKIPDRVHVTLKSGPVTKQAILGGSQDALAI